MSRFGSWIPGVGLFAAMWACGCQSSGIGGAHVPSFGIDSVPRQSEPAVEDDGRRSTVSAKETKDDAEEESAERKGNLLSRLLPAREKPSPERRPLPVSARTAAANDDDDSLDF